MNSFDEWNQLKQKLNHNNNPVQFFHAREIWHTHVGNNVGREIAGKNFFMRPVLVLKKLSPQTFLGAPLSRQSRNPNFSVPLDSKKESYVLLDQIKVFDARRIKRRKKKVSQSDWKKIQTQLSQVLQENPTLDPYGHEGESQATRQAKNTLDKTKSQTDLFGNLNPAQREAVEQVYGPVLVLAGPGTGKTHLLTTRIAHILQKTDCFPSNILCLTFTENAAVEMRRRLVKRVGNEAYQMQISTFHGFAQWIMDHYQSLFGSKVQGKNIADDLQKALIYQEIIEKKTWDYFRPSHDELSEKGTFMMALDQLKREHVTPEKLEKSLPEERARQESDPNNFYKVNRGEHKAGDMKPNEASKIERSIGKMTEFCELWKMYEKALDRNKLYDFNDLIHWVVDELQKNQELRYDLQERFQWILVDEYQDTNTAQNEILWALTQGVEDPNIFAVGDDDQSIYRFQGASMANIRDFRKRFAKRKEVTLEMNYRSYQPILDAAYASVSNNTERANKDKKLIAHNTNSQTALFLNSFHSPYSELQFLAQTIQDHLEKGVSPSEITILVRKNSEIERLSRELQKFGIKTHNPLSENIFLHKSVLALLDILQLLQKPEDSETLMRLLHADFWNIPAHDRFVFSHLMRSEKKSAIQLLIQNAEPNLFDAEIKPAIPVSVQEWGKWFEDIRINYGYLRPAVLIEKMLYESGLANFLTEKKDFEGWQCVKRFIDWARDNAREEDSIEALLTKAELHKQLGIPVRPNPLPPDPAAVQIMTAHKSKGLEFEVVFIPGLLNASWGNLRSPNSMKLPPLIQEEVLDDPNEEERRLFFVALTRAKRVVQMSYALSNLEGREKVPSQFIQEIPEELIQHIESKPEDEQINDLLPLFFEKQEKTLTNGEKELLQNMVKNFVWSATSLEAYLTCPRQFLYQYLYRLPRKPESSMSQGVALHQALERYFRADESKRSQALLLHEYHLALKGQNIPEKTYEQLAYVGTKILENYFANKLQNNPNPNEIYELEYNMGKHRPHIDGIALTGTIDKLVFSDNSKKIAHLVDYKSGKPRSIQKGDRLWRQLVFYDLLATYANGVSWKVKDCTLEFLTPDTTTGKLGTKTLVVTEEDRLQVIAELKEAHKKVMNLEFPTVDNPENDPNIEYWNHFGER